MNIELTGLEVDTLTGYLGELLETDPNDVLEEIYNKLVSND